MSRLGSGHSQTSWDTMKSRDVRMSGAHGLPADRDCLLDVRFGSKADMCSALTHVRFTPDSDRKSELPRKVVSALPPKADMCSAMSHVCFGP